MAPVFVFVSVRYTYYCASAKRVRMLDVFWVFLLLLLAVLFFVPTPQPRQILGFFFPGNVNVRYIYFLSKFCDSTLLMAAFLVFVIVLLI
jgi:hypothetical protein